MDLSSGINIFFSLLTLTFLEVVLGVDNLVFLAVISSRLPKSQQRMARRLGLLFALVTRLFFLAFVVILVRLKEPVLSIFSYAFSIRDLLLIAGGIFLLIKGTQEIHNEMASKETHKTKSVKAKVFSVVLQIGVLDIIFSLDSIFTAVALTEAYWVMATAICIAILAMIFLSEPLTHLIEKFPTVKMLALSFLILIGTVLTADGFHYHVPREYIYFAICFSLFVEILNNIARRRKK